MGKMLDLVLNESDAERGHSGSVHQRGTAEFVQWFERQRQRRQDGVVIDIPAQVRPPPKRQVGVPPVERVAEGEHRLLQENCPSGHCPARP